MHNSSQTILWQLNLDITPILFRECNIFLKAFMNCVKAITIYIEQLMGLKNTLKKESETNGTLNKSTMS